MRNGESAPRMDRRGSASVYDPAALGCLTECLAARANSRKLNCWQDCERSTVAHGTELRFSEARA